jgi:hypothetical protein
LNGFNVSRDLNNLAESLGYNLSGIGARFSVHSQQSLFCEFYLFLFGFFFQTSLRAGKA